MNKTRIHIDYRVASNCQNKEESYGEICVKCGKCGRKFIKGKGMIRNKNEIKQNP